MPKPGDIYIRESDESIWRVQSVCEEPTMTLERLVGIGEDRDKIGGAIGCLNFRDFKILRESNIGNKK